MVKLNQIATTEIYLDSFNLFDVEDRNKNLEVIYLHIKLKLNFDPDFDFFL